MNSVPLSNKFTSMGNKRIIWDLLIEHNVFNDIPDKYLINVKTEFEELLQNMSVQLQPSETILNANKQAILRMIDTANKYKVAQAYAYEKPAYEKPAYEKPAYEKPITANDISTKKQAQFQKGLQTKQEEFNNLMQPFKPAVIDFKDKTDEEPISEMDKKLAETIAWREQQLSQVLEKQNINSATEWINNGAAATTPPATNNSIKIGDVTNIDEKQIITVNNSKKVSFMDASFTDASFTDNQSKVDHSKVGQSKVDHSKVGQSKVGQSFPSDYDNVEYINTDDINNVYSPASNLTMSFMDKLKKKVNGNEENVVLQIDKAQPIYDKVQPMDKAQPNDKAHLNNAVVTQLDVNVTQLIKDMTQLIKDMTQMKQDMRIVIEQNKLLQEQQEKLSDLIERLSFNQGTI